MENRKQSNDNEPMAVEIVEILGNFGKDGNKKVNMNTQYSKN